MKQVIELTLEQILREFEPQAKEKDLVFQGDDCYDVFTAIPDEQFDYFRENYNALFSYSSINEEIDRDRFYVINTDLIKVKY